MEFFGYAINSILYQRGCVMGLAGTQRNGGSRIRGSRSSCGKSRFRNMNSVQCKRTAWTCWKVFLPFPFQSVYEFVPMMKRHCSCDCGRCNDASFARVYPAEHFTSVPKYGLQLVRKIWRWLWESLWHQKKPCLTFLMLEIDFWQSSYMLERRISD